MPSTTYIDRRFSSADELWRTLKGGFWQRRPVVFKAPLGPIFGDASHVLQGLGNLRGGPRTLQIHADGRAVLPAATHTLAAGDESLRTYVERLASENHAREIACIARQFETSHARIWFRCSAFLSAMHRVVGAPAGNASLELFLGNYTRTPFGLHKDVEDVVTYVLEGHKRFLVWPFAPVAERVGLSAAASRRSVMLPSFDYEGMRSSAFVLEGGCGDLLYWPWDHWHVAESEGEHSASLALGTAPWAGSKAVTSNVDPAIGEQQLYRRTRMGFRESMPLAVCKPLAAHDVIVAPVSDVLAWQQGAQGLVVSANGHGVGTAQHPGLVELLVEVNGGQPIHVGALRARYCEHGSFERDDLDELLEWLLRSRAVERCPRHV